MRAPRRTAVVSAVIAVTAIGLTGCNSSEPGSETASKTGSAAPTSAQPTGSASESSAKSAPSSSASAPSSEPSSSAPADDGPATAAPKSGRADSGDTSSLDAETTALPKGPVTDLTIKKLGGYAKRGGSGMFYAALSVDSTEPGLISLQYVLLDKSGKELSTVDDSINVAGTKNELKITRASGKLPPPSEGKVDKVRLRVVKNDSNQFATVTTIDPKITTDTDPASKVPVVKGRYKTSGKASVISLNAICSDKSGKVVVGNGPVPKIKAPTWTDYTVRLFDAPKGYTPTKCYVGS